MGRSKPNCMWIFTRNVCVGVRARVHACVSVYKVVGYMFVCAGGRGFFQGGGGAERVCSPDLLFRFDTV